MHIQIQILGRTIFCYAVGKGIFRKVCGKYYQNHRLLRKL